MTDTRLELRPYQRKDVRRALTEFNGRLLLKHRPGLGKSVMATRACEESPGVPMAPVVIICRTHLIIQWIKHLQKEYPEARIASVVEQLPNRRWRELSQAEKAALLLMKPGFDFYVLTFATIRRVKRTKERAQAQGQRTMKQMWADAAAENGWTRKKAGSGNRRPPFEYHLPPCRALIIDESHHFASVKSQQYAGAYQLAVSTQSRKAAERVVLLSATPAWREQDDLYAQLRLLDPRKFSSYWSFVKRYCILDETDFGAKVVGGHAKRIAKLLEGYAITRDYADPDVQIAIPELIEEEVWTTLSDAGLRAYTKQEAKLVRERKAGFGVGSGISDFSSITAHDKNKLADLDEVISSVDGHFVIFCWYVETAKMLGRLYDLPVFTGKAEPVRIRDEVVKVNRYTRSEVLKTAGSCIATIGCIQEGVDLSHLRTMVFYETDFTLGAMDQVRSRLKRWRADSSTDPIRCVYVLAASSVDEVAFERSQGRGATEREVMEELARLAEGREAHGVPQPT